MSNFGVMFLGSYALCIYATFFKDITWGICLYLMQYWLNPQTRWWYGSLPDVRWSFTISICIMGAYVMKMGKYTKNRLGDVPQTKWFALNLMVIIIINSWAVWPEMHSRFMTDHIKLLIFIFLTYKTIDNPKKFDAAMLTCMVGGFYVAHETRKKGRNQDGRVEGTGPADSGGDGNNASASLITLIPMLLYFVVKSHVEKHKLWKRLLLLLLLAFVGQAVVLINSRGAFIGLVLSCGYMGYFVFFNKKVTMKQRFQLIMLVVLGLCAFLALADDTFWERMSSISEESESESGGGGRKLFWTIAWNEVVRDYPMGAGGWGFAYLSPHYVPPEFMPQNASMRAVHSLYFQCIVERGYWGAPVWACLILSNFLFLRKIKKHLVKVKNLPRYFQALALESGFIAFLIAATFLNRLNCEILYWQPMFVACFGNIYLIKDWASKEVEERVNKKKK
jgi:hypothetical protein